MSRPQVRALVRPDYRRALVIGFALAASSLMWSSLAGAQDTSERVAASNHAPESVASLLALPSAATLASTKNVAAPSVTPASSGPVMTTAAVSFVPSVSRDVEATLDERMQDRRVGLGRNLALVIVGVAAMVIGSEVDDAPGTLMVVGGAGMTLYGLYYILR